MKKVCFILLLVAMVLSLSSCETTKGAAVGVGATVGGTATGVVQDSKNFWDFLVKTDAWLRKNAW
jgi:predicted small secreted protein